MGKLDILLTRSFLSFLLSSSCLHLYHNMKPNKEHTKTETHDTTTAAMMADRFFALSGFSVWMMTLKDVVICVVFICYSMSWCSLLSFNLELSYVTSCNFFFNVMIYYITSMHFINSIFIRSEFCYVILIFIIIIDFIKSTFIISKYASIFAHTCTQIH